MIRRIFGHMVMRNEADRYLDACLSWHKGLLDGIHIYDDQSTDDSVMVALGHGAEVTRRPDDVPSFLEHEGRFREAAWRAFEEKMDPSGHDWVLCFDADEFLVAEEDEATAMYMACQHAELIEVGAIQLDMPEVFRVEPDGEYLRDPQIRVDGWWGRLAQPRLFRYAPDGVWPDKVLASGAVPTYVHQGEVGTTSRMFLMHYGYAHSVDLEERYLRYTTHDAGHASAHIASIIAPPALSRWTGPHTGVWRGWRTRIRP